MTTAPSFSRRHGAAPGRGWAVLTAAPLGWILGVGLQVQQASLSAPAAYGAPLALAVGLAALARWVCPRAGAGALLLLCLLAGLAAGWGATGWRARAIAQQALAPALEGRDLVLTGVIDEMPRLGELGWRLVLAVEHAQLGGEAVSVPPRVQLAWYRRAPSGREATAAWPEAPLRAGDRWRFTVRLKAPHGNLNPHGFDHELWLWEQRIGATGYVRAGPRDAPPERLAQALGHRVERARQSVRDRILASAGERADPEAGRRAGIVAALVTGDQGVIERADWDVFRATGVAHLMSISGLHITMFAWLAAALVGALWRQLGRRCGRSRHNPCVWLPAPSAAWLGGLALAAGYAVFSGWGVPAQRTVLMLAGLTALRLAGLRWPWWLNWLWACAAVLALDPWAGLQPGFWLSFVAVAVLFATDSRAASAGQESAKARFVQLLREQGVVTLALTPLSLILFGQASVVGLLANLVAIPWVTLAITPVALAGVLWAPLWQLAAWALVPLLAVLQALAAWPWASVALALPPLGVGALSVLGGVLLAMRWPWPLRAAGVPLVLPLLLWQPARPAPGQFDLMAVDVGQGSAVLVRTAGHRLLYDAGPRYSQDSDAGQRVLVPLLRARGERLDRLVLSHRDSDHTGGAAAVLAQQPQALLLASLEPGASLADLPPAQPCLAGQRWDWDGVAFEVLHPTAAEQAQARNSNDISCVLQVRAAGVAALLTGDIGMQPERALVERHGAGLRSDVLLVPHHGSRSSSSALFLSAVQPRLALVQAGYRNRFGHPAAPVLARYADAGTHVFDSPRCGAIHWQSDAPDRVRCEREVARRYWHHRPAAGD